MRNLALCVISLGLCAVPAAYGANIVPETVDVDSANFMTGIWRIPAPVEVIISSEGTKFGDFHDAYCRVFQSGEDLKANCLGDGFRRDGEGEIDGGDIHLGWGNFMVRFVVNAKVKSTTSFAGTFGIKLSGIEMTDPNPVTAIKLTPSLDAPDSDGLAGTLRNAIEELTAGGLSMQHDKQAIAKLDGGAPLPTPDKLHALGNIQALLYLGQTNLSPNKNANAESMSVYSVEFANGQRLCALHRRADGVLDALQCA